MIDISNAEYSDRWDNDTARQTEIYFDLPKDISCALAAGQFKKEYQKVLDGIKHHSSGNAIPHMELQVNCPYGESLKDIGSVALGIGIQTAIGIEILDTVELVPGADYEEKDVFKLWNGAITKG